MLKVAGDEARSREKRRSELGGVRANIPTTLVRQNKDLSTCSMPGACTWYS